MLQIVFLGGGSIVQAILEGIYSDKQAENEVSIAVVEVTEKKRKNLSEIYPSVTVYAPEEVKFDDFEIVVIATKPQDIVNASKLYRNSLKPEHIICSFMAGVKVANLELLFEHKKIVRVMPNVAAQVKEAVSTYFYCEEAVLEADVDKVVTFIELYGLSMKMDSENFLEASTALNGTCPGLVFMFMEALQEAGLGIGLPANLTRKLITRCLIGSSRMALKSDQHFAELRNMVTSPGGTTASAIKFMEKSGFRNSVMEGVWAAYNRALSIQEGNAKE